MAACSRCSGLMQYVPEKNMLKCPFCGNEEPLEQMIKVENLNVSSGVLDADTMFEHWLITLEDKLRKDFAYYYATDPRNEFITVSNVAYWPSLWASSSVEEYNRVKRMVDRYEKLVDDFLVGERYGKYRETWLAKIEKKKKDLSDYEENLRKQEAEAAQKIKEAELKKEQDEKITPATIIGTIIFIALIVIPIVCLENC